MPLYEAHDHQLVRLLFHRGLALVYLVAFLVAADQWRGLLGEDGLLPVPAFLERADFREAPSLFHWTYSDRLAEALAWFGAGLAVAAFLGVPSAAAGTAGSVVAWFALWALYLSFVNVGQVFYAFGWESQLLETGFLAIFLGAAGTEAPEVVVWLLRWLLFRVMLGAGLIKIRGDSCWRASCRSGRRRPRRCRRRSSGRRGAWRRWWRSEACRWCATWSPPASG